MEPCPDLVGKLRSPIRVRDQVTQLFVQFVQIEIVALAKARLKLSLTSSGTLKFMVAMVVSACWTFQQLWGGDLLSSTDERAARRRSVPARGCRGLADP